MIKLTLEDIKEIKDMMDNAKVPTEGRLVHFINQEGESEILPIEEAGYILRRMYGVDYD